jgi:hypothetical protein
MYVKVNLSFSMQTGRRHNYIKSQTRHKIGARGQLDTPAALSPRERALVALCRMAEWTSEPV